MFGSSAGFFQSPNADWGERVLNTVVSQSIRHLFTESEAVEVEIHCQPSSKLLQGSVDSFKMCGTGLVIRRDFRVEEMSFETDAVAVDFSSVLKGQLQLKQPTQAIAQIRLSQKGLVNAFQSDLVRKRLRFLENPELTQFSNGEPVSFSNIQIELLPNNRVQLGADVDLSSNGKLPVRIEAKLVTERRRRILFDQATPLLDAVPEADRDRSQALANAFIDILNNMVDLDRFDLDGVTMRINRLETQGQDLLFSGYAQIDRFPGS